MRTTLDIDDDILIASRELAQRRRVSIGKIVSELARPALQRDFVTEDRGYGFRILPRRGLDRPITLDEVNRLRDEAP